MVEAIMLKNIDGYKTYLTAAAIAVYAIAGVALGLHSPDRVVELLLQASALIGLRHGISKV